MKKIIFAIMAAGSLLAGCTLETNVENPELFNKRHVTIQADIIRSKTTVTDEGVYSWSANETIGVVEQDGSEVIPFSIEDAEHGFFSGTLSADKDPVFAVSPAAFVSNVAESGGLIEYDITLDNINNYVPGTTNAIMVAPYSGKDGDNYRFHFNHVAALVKVSVVNVPVGTAKVKLTLDKNITGIWADLDSTNPVLNEDTDLGDPSLTLTLKKAVTNPNTSADYYFPVPCNTYTSFQFEMLNADGDRLKGVKKTGRNIVLDAGDLFLAPTITLDPVTIVKGAEWTYTFSAKQYSDNGTVTLTDAEDVSMDWTLAGNPSDAFWGYDGTKGQQFGSGTKPYSSLTLTADSGVNGIEDVVINTSGASSINAAVSVSVGGTPFVIKGSDPAKTSQSLTSTATEYTFTSPDGELYVGDIVISYANSSSKAIYIKTISLNPDTRIDPELAYSPAAYSVVASSSFETPELSSVAGFDGTVTYAIGGEDDPDVASVNAETGAVTIGTKAGSVTVTASFEGNATYKPGSASYTITVGAASLSVSTNNPAAAECTAGATATFTVTSNVEWSATTTDDGTIITNISPSGAQSPSADPVTVTVTFAENAGAQRTATVNVKPSNQTSYSALNQAVTMTQKPYTADVVYEKYSGVLTAGTYLIVDATAHVALRSVISSDRAAYTTVAEYVTGKIRNPMPSIVWEIAASGDYWTVYSDTTSSYIASTGAKNKAQLLASGTDDKSKWSVASTAQSTTYDFVNKQNTTNSVNATLRYNSGYGFATYASGTGNPLTLYKLVDNTVWDLSSIAVKTEPTKVTYEAGEQFDPTGLVITATYSDHDGVKDDKTVDVAYNNTTAEQFTFSPTTSAALTTDNTSVSITWGGKSTTQAITVAATYILTLSSGGNGTVAASVDDTAVSSGSAVAVGKTVSVTTTPSSGYQLASLSYNDGSAHDITDTKSFTMPAHAVTVTATFSAVPTIGINKTSITNVAAAGVTNASESGVYSFYNGATDADVTVTCDGSIVTAASKNNGAITYSVAANTGAARDGWIKIQYATEDPHTVTVNQLSGAQGTEHTATIIFGSASGSTNINAASKTGSDSEGNTWTITTAGTTSFTPNSSYSQIGSSKNPASSITFTTTLSSSATDISLRAKFGGFSGTAGTVTLKVGDTSIGTGSLNATSDVTVTSSSTGSGTVLTVTVTGISKGVKAYFIEATYTN